MGKYDCSHDGGHVAARCQIDHIFTRVRGAAHI